MKKKSKVERATPRSKKSAARALAVGAGSDSRPMPGTPEWSNMHTTVAVMVEGRRHAICAYLRDVASSIEMGCTSGMTGDCNPARGQWIGLR